ncbi:hypothetical protein CQ012_02425 [Arthrobacter sp. MYb214]|uniref:hypothetical protein n=1 Tax=Arthrobacter sp. MYb214 TaxID=1848596 RepID=UPI000CFB8E84|nr:hypothetical protein [Arthrobacter sp. MYb214]PRB78264.1 hypothetical protein CQ012_02425 [Arthrobacter sp. MYb214]
MSNLPGNPFAEGPDNYRETLHELGKSHLAYEISAALALAYEQRLVTLATLFNLPDGSAIPGVDYAEAARQLSEGLGMRAEK